MKVSKDAKDRKYGRTPPATKSAVEHEYKRYLKTGSFSPGTRPAVKKAAAKRAQRARRAIEGEVHLGIVVDRLNEMAHYGKKKKKKK